MPQNLPIKSMTIEIYPRSVHGFSKRMDTIKSKNTKYSTTEYCLAYTEFILVRLWRKLLAYRNTVSNTFLKPTSNKCSFLLKETTACLWLDLNQCGLLAAAV